MNTDNTEKTLIDLKEELATMKQNRKEQRADLKRRVREIGVPWSSNHPLFEDNMRHTAKFQAETQNIKNKIDALDVVAQVKANDVLIDDLEEKLTAMAEREDKRYKELRETVDGRGQTWNKDLHLFRYNTRQVKRYEKRVSIVEAEIAELKHWNTTN